MVNQWLSFEVAASLAARLNITPAVYILFTFTSQNKQNIQTSQKQNLLNRIAS